MQTAYQDPHIISGSHSVFEMTLVNASAGNLPVNHAQTITSNWGTTEEIIPQGHNLLLTFDLKPLIHQFQVGIGGGDIISIIFK
jgi:spore coat polysaccharide biosynthesis predicted glycosyltransferase SpsG